MAKEAATLLAKMKLDNMYDDIAQRYSYYLNLLDLVITEKPMTQENYSTLVEELIADGNSNKSYSKEAAELLNALLK